MSTATARNLPSVIEPPRSAPRPPSWHDVACAHPPPPGFPAPAPGRIEAATPLCRKQTPRSPLPSPDRPCPRLCVFAACVRSFQHPPYQQCGHSYTDRQHTQLRRPHRRLSSCRRWNSSSAWRLSYTTACGPRPPALETPAASTPATPCKPDTSGSSAPSAPLPPMTSKPYVNALPWPATRGTCSPPAIH